MIRVVIFDDSDERRESLEELFSLPDIISCVGSFSGCSQLQEQLSALCPDVVLMDIRMPGLDGITATRLIKERFPGIRIIMQTVYDDDENIFSSLRAGAEGYILKSTPGEKIIQSIADVYSGGAVITPSIALKVTRFFSGTEQPGGDNGMLTPREKEVLRLLTEGLSYKMVSSRLGVSYNTVNSHIKRIYEKLSVNSMGEAVSLAIRNRLV